MLDSLLNERKLPYADERMPEQWTALGVFPSNGLDRSLHAPVFIGLLLLSFFKETLGWTYAGLVVPGYLATVFLAAPVTGVLVVIESLLTYAVSSLLGRVLPRTGAWFTFFGRERFLLIIGVASFVRLVMEASLVPAWMGRLGLSHSRELYSLGLVLVPLLSNSYWNAGVVRALPRVCVVTGVTYLVVSQVLLRYTNFTLSRFQVANESVSLAFLETPHAHIILLIGAVLGARNNVRYGWDYNGILVPALLSVAWYQPSKVLATIVEALVVFKLSQWVLRVPGLSKLLVVGSRRLAVTFGVGFVVKYVLGFALLRWAPTVQMVDLFGFGYLLPSLLAVKFWDKQKVLRVLMPTLSVSVLAFPLGIGVGYALRWLSPPATVLGATTHEMRTVDSLSLELMRGDSAPAPHRTGAGFKEAGTYAAALALAERVRSGEYEAAVREAERLHLFVGQTRPGDWLLVTPRAIDPNEDALGPRAALRLQRAYGDSWLVVVEPEAVASAVIPIAVDLAERLGAAAIVVRSRLPEVRRGDDAFVQQLSGILGIDQTLVVRLSRERGEATAQLSVVGSVPEDLSPSAIERRLGVSVETQHRAVSEDAAPQERAAQLIFGLNAAEAAGSRLLKAEPIERWQLSGQGELARQLQSLVGTAAERFRAPSVPEVRLFGSLVEARMNAARRAPNDWERALAQSLGLRFAELEMPGFAGWALFEPVGDERRGAATWLQRRQVSTPNSLEPGSAPAVHATPNAGKQLLFAAAPRWESGVLGAATALLWANGADALLLHGALPQAAADGSADARRVEGRQSFFQRAYEAWVTHGGKAMALRGMDPLEQPRTPLVVTFDAEVDQVSAGPPWVQPLLSAFSRLELTIAAFDGSAERAGFSASSDPAVAFGRRFAPGSTVTLWLRQDLREALAKLSSPRPQQWQHETQRFGRLGLAVRQLQPSQWVEHRRRCLQGISGELDCAASLQQAGVRPAAQPPKDLPQAGLSPSYCDSAQLAAALSGIQRYLTTRNPYWLQRVLADEGGCGLVLLEPPGRDELWLSLLGPSQASMASAAADGSGGGITYSEYLFPLVHEPWSEQLCLLPASELPVAERLPLRALEIRLP